MTQENTDVSPPCRLVTVVKTALASLLGVASTPHVLAAQDLAGQTLGRAYWHVFAAYAVLWLLVFGWAVSISRRLSRVERRVER